MVARGGADSCSEVWSGTAALPSPVGITSASGTRTKKIGWLRRGTSLSPCP